MKDELIGNSSNRFEAPTSKKSLFRHKKNSEVKFTPSSNFSYIKVKIKTKFGGHAVQGFEPELATTKNYLLLRRRGPASSSSRRTWRRRRRESPPTAASLDGGSRLPVSCQSKQHLRDREKSKALSGASVI